MKLHQLIDIDLYPNKDLIYSGVCLKKNAQIFVLLNYKVKKRCFDGFTVFRSDEITKYRYWTDREIARIKKDNRQDFQSILPLERIKTFYSVLNSLSRDNLISFFTNNKNDTYQVGKIIGLTRNNLTLRLIDQEGNWIGTRKIKLVHINYFSFLTDYEKGLISNLT
jgi:hypothetical protein